MKLHERLWTGFAALLLFATACSGGSESAGEATPVPGEDPTAAVETPTAAEESPTVDPRTLVTDDDLIAAAAAQLEADVAADPGPLDLAGVAAYDLLDSRIEDDGTVTMTICAWNGDTVFDRVRDSLYRTEVADDGTITATHIATPLAPGECLNTTLVEEALAAAEDFDAFTRELKAEPAAFAANPRAETLLTSEYLSFSEPRIAEWVADGVSYPHSRAAGPLSETAVNEVLWRRTGSGPDGLLEFVFCRPMNPQRGLYMDGVLIDDGRPEGGGGPHSVDSFEMRLDADTSAFRLAGSESLVWADCLVGDEWQIAVNQWLPLDIELKPLQR